MSKLPNPSPPADSRPPLCAIASRGQDIIDVSVRLPCAEALALAQFVKRVGFSEIRDCAANDNEAYEIRSALSKVREGLADAGFAPR